MTCLKCPSGCESCKSEGECDICKPFTAKIQG